MGNDSERLAPPGAGSGHHHPYLLLPGLTHGLGAQFLKWGTRAPCGLEETVSSPQLVLSLHPRAFGTVSCSQSHLRTEGCPVCQRQFPCPSGNKPTDPKTPFHKERILENELSAGSLHCTSPTIMTNSISVLILSGIYSKNSIHGNYLRDQGLQVQYFRRAAFPICILNYVFI